MSSLTFTNFYFLGLIAPLFFIPIVIHLLNKKFPEMLHFSSIHFIKAAMRRKSQLFRLRDWILTFLRILILCVLVLIFSKPNLEIFGSANIKNKKREIIILFDNSLSMQYEKGGITPFSKGIIEAEKIIDAATGADLVNIVNVGMIPMPLENESTNQLLNLKTRLRNLKPRLGTADFTAAIAWALVHYQAKSNQKELYVISDFQRQTWGKVKLPHFEGKCFYVNVGYEKGENIAVLNASFENSLLIKDEDINLEATLCNYSDREKTVPVSIHINNIKVVSQDVTLTPWSTTQKTFNFNIKKGGNYSGVISVPDDYLKADNQFYFTINIKDKERVLIISDEENSQNNSAYFLMKALNPYGAKEGNYYPEIKSLTSLNPVNLTGIRKLFLTRVGSFSPDQHLYIKQFILNGGSIVYFLDGSSDAENLKALETVFDNTVLPARISIRQSGSAQGTGARKFLKGDFKSPFLKIFDGPNREKLNQLKFYDYYLSATNQEKGVLLFYDDNSPALFFENYGQGKIIFCNFSVNELESNLARQEVFPVWMQEIAHHLNTNQFNIQNYELNQTTVVLTDSVKVGDGEIISPNGTIITDKNLVSRSQGKIKLKLDQQGIYRVVLPSKEELLSVNITSLESDIRSVELDRLPKNAKDTEPVKIVSGAEDYKAIKEGIPLFHYVAIALLIMLGIEVGLQWLLNASTTAKK